jgi:hypothetical protein
MTVPEPPDPLDPAPARYQLAAGTRLHRIHADRFAGNGFNPCKGDPTRFAPIHRRGDGACVPSLYAATSFDAAAYETVFHDIAPDTRFKTVRREALLTRAHSVLELARPLTLARFFRPDMTVWDVAAEDILGAPAAAFATTARWASVVHAADPALQGLVWTSNCCDPDLCLMLFGDRVEDDALGVAYCRAGDDESLMRDFRTAAARAGITIGI